LPSQPHTWTGLTVQIVGIFTQFPIPSQSPSALAQYWLSIEEQSALDVHDPAQSPVEATDTPAMPASQALSYDFPSHPQTLATVGLHVAGMGWHVPVPPQLPSGVEQ
jgi:hypothetical protein